MDTRKLEKITKGIANHRRIQIMDILDKKPALSVFEISDLLKANFKTISEHLRRLTHAGLILKNNTGSSVRHVLSENGKLILKFLRTLE